MAAKRLLTLFCAALTLTVLTTACSRKRPPETDVRGRTETPPPTTERPSDTGNETDEAAAARERAYNSLTEMIFFDFDRSELKDDARATLQRKADVMRDNPDVTLRIEGHCDERGTVEYNLALGERRAEAAKQYLVDLGIDPDRLTTISYGEERPLEEGHNEAAWSRNRRDEFVPIGL